MTMSTQRPTNLQELRASGWVSKTVKQELRDNFLKMLASGEELFPGIVGYENTVVPEINIALIAGHDMLFLGEKGQGKSRLMRSLARLLDDAIPFLNLPGIPLHDDPFHPITSIGKRFLAEHAEDQVPIGWCQSNLECLRYVTLNNTVGFGFLPFKLAEPTRVSADKVLNS